MAERQHLILAAPVRLSLLLLLGLLVFLLALSAGSQGFDPLASVSALTGGSPVDRDIVLELRLPRALMAFGCGALLAVAGALLQALLRNPLADPFVLGISGGAGALALLAMFLGAGGLLISLAGIAGAITSTALLYLLAWRGGLLPNRLLLAGIILGSAWGAAITLLLALAPDAPLRGMVFWLMGDLSSMSYEHAGFPLLAALLSVVLAWPLARGLDALKQGDLSAAALGVPVARLRSAVLLLAAVATAVAVVSAGSIGFIGLVTPHLLRLAGLRRHRILLPACLLGGGSLLLLADTAARTIAVPQQLPVGAITAAIGAPLFLWLFLRSAPR